MNQEEVIKNIICKCANDIDKLKSIKNIIDNIYNMDLPEITKIEMLYKSLRYFPINS